MKRGIAAAWIGGIVVLGTGIGLHLRNQTVAGAKVANSAMENTSAPSAEWKMTPIATTPSKARAPSSLQPVPTGASGPQR